MGGVILRASLTGLEAVGSAGQIRRQVEIFKAFSASIGLAVEAIGRATNTFAAVGVQVSSLQTLQAQSWRFHRAFCTSQQTWGARSIYRDEAILALETGGVGIAFLAVERAL